MCRFSTIPDVNEGRDNIHNNLDIYKSTLNENIASLRNEINFSFDRLIQAIEERRKMLVDGLQGMHGRKEMAITSDTNSFFNRNLPMMKSYDMMVGNGLHLTADNEKILDLIKGYGSIDENGASSENSMASGFALKYGISNECNQFQLKTYNNSNEITYMEKDKVEVFLKGSTTIYSADVRNNLNGVYNISYEVEMPGKYEIHVHVNGRCVKNSPYVCNVFEKENLNFVEKNNEIVWNANEKQQNKSALVEKTGKTTKLYSNIATSGKAWRVRVTSACSKLKLKLGYSNELSSIPDLNDEFYCKFDFSEIFGISTANPYHRHHTHHHKHHHTKRLLERKLSMYKRKSATFLIFQDGSESKIHVAVEGTDLEKTIHFSDGSHSLAPFIGIKHSCNNENCPRPLISFL